MCTCIDYHSKHHYFGRTLDLDHHYNEEVIVSPRSHKTPFLNGQDPQSSYAMVGMATLAGDYPLYYEACNEMGLAMAGLYFVENAEYFAPQENKLNLAVFELMPYFLGKFGSIAELKPELDRLNITNQSFDANFPSSPMHWMMCDKKECIVIEQRADGLHIYDNPAHVMTNNPSFDIQLASQKKIMRLNCEHIAIPEDFRNELLNLAQMDKDYVSSSFVCDGYGALGLPGDQSSNSRFLRVSFNLSHSCKYGDPLADAVQFFHILDSVSDVKGTVISRNGAEDSTLYTSCIDTDDLVYYYKTYENPQISAVRLSSELSKGPSISHFALSPLEIKIQN